LDEKNISFQVKEDKIYIPYEIDGKKFQVTIQIMGNKWIVVLALILRREYIPDDVYCDLLKDLLLAIHELPEITYDIDKEGNIYTGVDMRLNITDYDNFFSEFYAIPFGIKRFIEKIAPKYNLKIPDQSI